MRIGYIYKITCLKNDKFVIGSSINRHRWSQHLSALNRNKHGNPILQNYYNKYGKNSIIFEIVQSKVPENILLHVEDIWIGALCSMTEDKNKGMNVRKAFRGKNDAKACEKISKNNIGKKHTVEAKEKISNSLKGRKQNKESIDKRIETRRKNGSFFISEDRKKYLSELNKGKPNFKNSKVIYQLDLNGNIIKKWNSAQEASKIGGFSFKNISSTANGNRKTHAGFMWKFEKDL
jgi:group I intron endonuclease